MLDPAFGPGMNPLRHLGSLTIFFFWIVLVSGIWLFAFFHTSVTGAYESVEYLTHDQWYLGGVMRSLHRYASDAAIITLALHITKEFSFDRHRYKRWFSWVTGVPLLWLVIPLGITGYWLVWDQLAQYVALASAELIDWLPIFFDSMARNFLSDESLSDRFFTLMAFLHLIGLPLFLVFGIWLHVFRITAPEINPPRVLMAGALLAMLVLSLVYPALSQGQADLSRVPQSLGLDWYYLLVYPLMKTWSVGWVWALLGGISLLLCLAPWLPPPKTHHPAVVNLDNCNGCARCVDDCPFSAVSMAPRSDGKPHASEPVVDPDLCISCGICVGACPTATPFRARSLLIPGIDLPDMSAAWIRETVETAVSSSGGKPPVLVFACKTSRGTRAVEKAGKPVVEVRCMAQLPPSFIDYVLSRDLADGVFLAGCEGGDCQFRLGATWTEQRLARQRDPRLRKRVIGERIALGWLEDWSRFPDTLQAVVAFENELSGGPLPVAKEKVTKRRYGPAKILASVVTYGVFAGLVGWLSVWPEYRLIEPGQAVISLTFSHAGQRVGECRRLSPEELAELPPNMRNPMDCPRERHPVQVVFSADGDLLYQESRPASGLWSDGESSVYQRLLVTAGRHRLFIGMRDSDRTSGFDYQREEEILLEANQHLVVEFDDVQKTFVFR
jgi:quinol-cytochrome oxidoreductase complex cytochrome b subunit/coenzyme F420-reducing hydrogenase delta subunit